MKLKELIDRLKKFNKEYEVKFVHGLCSDNVIMEEKDNKLWLILD